MSKRAANFAAPAAPPAPAAPAPAAPDPHASLSAPPPPALQSGWASPAGVALGVLSAAKGALKLAPVVMDSASQLAQSGTQNAFYYARRGVELGSGAVRQGVTYTGEAAASALESYADSTAASAANAGADPAAAAAAGEDSKWRTLARRTRAGTKLLDKGLEWGSDIVEDKVIGAVGAVAGASLGLAAQSVQRSMRTTKLLVGAADVFAKGALKASGVDVAAVQEANGHEKLIDAVLNIISELRTLNASLSSVGTPELVRVLMTYARLVETVEAESLFRARRPLLSAHLQDIGEARRAQWIRAEQNDARGADGEMTQVDAGDAASSSGAKGGKRRKSKGAEPTSPNGGVLVSSTTETTGPRPPAKKRRSWWGWGSSGSDDASAPAAPEGPAPSLPGDPAPSAGERYQDGLYMLAGSGMRKVSRAMLFSGCAYGPRFMKFLGVQTRAQTHEEFIVEQCGIARTDLLLADFNSSLAHPGYFLAVDHSSRQVLLVIRGSSAWHDALTDLTCSLTRHVTGSFGSKGHAEGSCHEGMLKSAQWFADHLRKPILEARARNPGYELVLTGHSLGGGVGSLLALLWLHDRQMNPEQSRLQGFFFGSPCTVSAELAHLGYGYIWNFILGHDVVCRLSKGAVQDLCGVVLALTVASRRRNDMLALPSRQRRKAQEAFEAAQAKERAEAIKKAGANPLPFIHPAASDHKLLAAMLDRYHALMERQKKDGANAPLTAAEEKEAQASADEIAKAQMAGSAAAPPAAASSSSSAAGPRTLGGETTALLAHMTSILLQLRKSMTHEKLFPLGHIFHLLPKDDSGAEDRKEREEVDHIAASASSAEQGGSASVIPASSSASSAAGPSGPQPRRKSVLASRVERLDDIIGAQPEAMMVDEASGQPAAAAAPPVQADAEFPSAGKDVQQPGANASKVAAAFAANAAPGGPAMMEDVATASAVAPAVGAGAKHHHSWLPGCFSSGAASPGANQAAPVAAPAAAPALARPRSIPVAMPVASPAAGAGASNKRKSSSISPSGAQAEGASWAGASVAGGGAGGTASVPGGPPGGVVAPMSQEDVIMASASPNVNAPSLALAPPPPASAPPLSPQLVSAAYSPPVAVPVPRPVASIVAPTPQQAHMFTHPKPYDIVAGHWSDLTDLILSSNMLQHHLPASYFVALATHETTRAQSEEERKLKQLHAEQQEQRARAAAAAGAAATSPRPPAYAPAAAPASSSSAAAGSAHDSVYPKL